MQRIMTTARPVGPITTMLAERGLLRNFELRGPFGASCGDPLLAVLGI